MAGVDDNEMEYENQEDANNSQASTNSADLRLIGTLQPPGSPVTTQPTRINNEQYSPSRSINDQVDQDHGARTKPSAKFKIKLSGSFPEKWNKAILEKALQSWCNSDLSREVKDECSVLNLNLIDKSNAEGEITLPIEVLKKLTLAHLKFKENNKELTVTAHFLNETKPQNSGSLLVEQKFPPQKGNNLESDSAAAERHSDKDIPGVDRASYPSYVEPIEAAKVTAEMTSPLTGLTVPLYHYLYMHEAYRKELEQMEQQYGVTICTEVSVSFKPKVSTNSDSVSKISKDFQELVQQHLANLKSANIPYTCLDSEIMREILNNLQLENKKIMMIMSARNCLLFGPQNVTDMINRRCGLVAGVEAAKLENQLTDQSSKMEVDNPSIDMDIKDLQTQLKMDKIHWDLMELSCKEQLLHLETKYGVSFHPEELQDNLIVKVRAQSKEGQHNNLERHALRALMQLYQKFAMATVTCEPKNPKDANIVTQIKEKLHKQDYCVVTVETHGSLRLVGLPEHLGPAMADIEKTLGKNVFDEKTKKFIGYSGNIPQTRRIKRESTPIYGQGATRGHSLDEKIKSEEGGKETHGEEEQCPICMDSFNNKTKLKCQHEFCKDCLKRSVESLGPICPVCKEVFGKVEGNQPDGTMNVVKHRSRTLPGYHNCGTIEISYNIPSGIQRSKHPNPGQPYHGAHRTAYLPDNHEGNEVLKLLKKAFDQKLIFTVGTSTTTGVNNVVTWNDIHHKTNMYGGPQSYGYPDPDYLKRVKEELKAKGIE